MKYVMINECMPIIFSDAIPHADFKQVGEITSAGFVTEMGSAHGHSESLNMRPAVNDTFFLQQLLREKA